MSGTHVRAACYGVVGTALLFLVPLSGCFYTEREYQQAKDASEELAEKVARLERALAEIQQRPAPEPQLQKRVEEQGKGLAELRARFDEVSAQAASLQGRVEVLERGVAGDRESNRAALSPFETRLADLDKRLEKLQASSARPPEPPRQTPPSSGPEKAPPAPPAAKNPAQALYDEAYTLYRKQGKHDEAREKFKVFMQTYPESSLIPNAFFWVGESYYDQQQYEAAILEYDSVIKKFPKSDKVPSALLKQAFAFDSLNDAVGAKTLLKKLIRDFPKSDQAAIAQKKLDVLGD